MGIVIPSSQKAPQILTVLWPLLSPRSHTWRPSWIVRGYVDCRIVWEVMVQGGRDLCDFPSPRNNPADLQRLGQTRICRGY